METAQFLAFDLGATSGRAMLGTLSGGRLALEEVHRFPNRIVRDGSHLRWDLDTLCAEILTGLKKGFATGADIRSAGIDTWGVDVACFDAEGRLLGQPYCYRDPAFSGSAERFFAEKMSRERLYARTGIQVMDFNTLFQFDTLRRNAAPELEKAAHILFLPDALTYMLTGKMVTEYTIASTSHLLDPVRRRLDPQLLEAAGVSPACFSPLVQPGTIAGLLRPEVARACGIPQIPVVSVAGHDTASAVAAIPATSDRSAYLSSGTWSLMGIESPLPILSTEAAQADITNEGGVFGTTRFLKNITGMWIVENLLKEWEGQGTCYTYDDLPGLSDRTEPFACFIDPDDGAFAHPDSMPAAIDAFCERTGQQKPDSHAAYIRTVFESLAMRYQEVLCQIVRIAAHPVDVLHIIGGGSKNRLLNRFTANATGKTVVAGPSEATAIGNVMLQAYAAGMVKDLHAMRACIASSFPAEVYAPGATTAWHKGFKKYQAILR